MDLAEFLLARLFEDEQVARDAMPGPWVDGYVAPEHLADGIVYGQSAWIGHLGQACDVRLAHVSEGNAAHITRHDPVRVLAEVAAKRAIIDEHSEFMDSPSFGKPLQGKGICRRCCDIEGSDWDGPPTVKYPCDTLRLLVLPYAEHPECHPSWLPAVKA